MSRLERSVAVAAPPDAVWSVLADFGAISGWVPLVQHSCLLSEQTGGVGAVRRVQIARQTLVERVVTWRPASELAYDIEGLPPIVGPARNTWRLASSPAGTDVTLTTEIRTGPNPIGRLVARKVLERMATASELMLAGLAATAPSARHERPESEERT